MCPGEDLNLQGLLHTHLKRTRLPFRHPGDVVTMLLYQISLFVAIATKLLKCFCADIVATRPAGVFLSRPS